MKYSIQDGLNYIKGLPDTLKLKAQDMGILKKSEIDERIEKNKLYDHWLKFRPSINLEEQVERSKHFKHRPLISILMPAYQVELPIIKIAVESVLNQTYPYYELIIADDCSNDEEFLLYLYELSKTDDRIKVIFREENGGISEATNTAFREAKGEFIALLDDDDVLAPNALYEVVKVINEFPDVGLIYTDEDKINLEGKREQPHFKSDYAPDTLMSTNYICHFLVIRRSLIEGDLLNGEYDGSQDFDLVLRVSEKAKDIKHIPQILYHWRITPGSTAAAHANKDYAVENGRKAIDAALKRRGLKGQAIRTPADGYYQVNYDILDPNKKVSIIIPTKDNPEDLVNCVDSILEKTDYKNYEIIVINNNSTEEETFRIFEELQNRVKNLRVYDLPIPFNYSRINNFAAEKATGDFYLFLNDDTKILTQGWMTHMLGYAQQPWIGAVGVKLIYPDNTIQHGGVVVGLVGDAGHVFESVPNGDPGYMSRLRQVTNYSAVTAACMMVEKKKFWQVDGFDENLAVAFNDVDLCLKLVEAGYYNVFLPHVEIWHFESKTRGYEVSPAKTLRFDKEKGRLRRRWRDYIMHDPMYNPNLTLLRGDFTFDV